MTEADKSEVLRAIKSLERGDLSHPFLAALLLVGGTGAFLFLHSVLGVFHWHS